MAEIMISTLNMEEFNMKELHNVAINIDKFEELREEIDFINKQYNRQQRTWKKYKWIKSRRRW